MTVNGLPLHPLIVHATVVALPVLAFLALGYLNPRWRHGLRWPLFAMAVVAAVLIFFTARSGDSLKNSLGPSLGGVLGQRIHRHEQLAGYLQVATYIDAGLVALVTLFDSYLRKVRWLPWLASALLAIGAIAVIVLTVMTGEAGARAAWGGA